MPLSAGVRFGPYEVVEHLGRGGMGDVYRARDARLRRDVALKVVQEAHRFNPDTRAQLEREAQALAAVNHPNIATVHGVEEADGIQALVMELVEGETLAHRVETSGLRSVTSPHGRSPSENRVRPGGGLSLREALAIARQLTDALEAAHERGIIHRDLKPANIKLRPDGTVKVLDFGLAKALDAESGDGTAATATLTSEHIVRGTPSYMSPEQARGAAVDRRTDIWAFGCVLYEMLTGRRAFDGASSSDVIASVLDREPDLTALPATTPDALRRLLRRCLTKDPKDRLRDISDARLEIDEATLPVEEVSRDVRPRRQWRWIAAAALVAAAMSGIAVWLATRAEPLARSVIRFTAASGAIRSVAISSDGARIAYRLGPEWIVRARDRLDVTVLKGLGAFADQPFFSPDGEWLAYIDTPLLKKISVNGGAPVVVVDVGPGATASWSPGGIVFANIRGVFRIPGEGATAERLAVDLESTEQATYPHILPGGEAVIYTVVPARDNFTVVSLADSAGARLEVADLRSGTRKTLVRGGSQARYLPTGHLMFVMAGTLHAVAFDLDRMEVRGKPVQIDSEASTSGVYAVSDDGTLIYATRNGGSGNGLVWVDRQGREEPLDAPPLPYIYPRLSPDGTRVALDVAGPPERDIWMWDLRRKALERFTADGVGNPIVAWSLDGRHVAFGGERFGPSNLFLQAADRSGEPERLLVSDRIQMPINFAADGRLLVSEEVPGQRRNIHALTLDGTRRVEVLIQGPANELTAENSPDGKWLAYDSDESGQFEVYVRPYPNVNAARWQISSGGGRQPLWSRDGRELFYRDYTGAIMVTPVTVGPTFVPGEVNKLIDNAGYAGAGNIGSGRTYDVSLDNSRFLMIKLSVPTDKTPPSLVVVVNWFEELKRLLPTE